MTEEFSPIGDVAEDAITRMRAGESTGACVVCSEAAFDEFFGFPCCTPVDRSHCKDFLRHGRESDGMWGTHRSPEGWQPPWTNATFKASYQREVLGQLNRCGRGADCPLCGAPLEEAES